MIRLMSPPAPELAVVVHPRAALAARLPALTDFVRRSAPVVPLGKHPAWLGVLNAGLGHEVFALEAVSGGTTHGFLPLAHVSGPLFGRFLVSLPYLNSNGVVAASADVQALLVSRAATLADELNVRYLELRQEAPVDHPDLTVEVTSKVHMRLALPKTADALWKRFAPKVRNQVRKGERHGFAVAWGGAELLADFYAVLTENMRDLGTPVYGIGLFREILAAFPGAAEVCVLRTGGKPAAAALLLHGWGTTEVPTASALKELNPTCVNMLMYWQLLKRAVERGQTEFDFGRSTADGPTFRFKKQWGAEPRPAVWQYAGHAGGRELHPDNPRYQRAIRVWQRLPVGVTKLLGPAIVRGIP
ncbi:FemAB family XrtA/PEP-CTERM system-associated protein [Urbifossiella limnaea]|uniref:FemAB family protein n=1 Tax=Urbifossiella limnaea TaxID=2528023 RepID=A0A517XRG0_9BACT|nr:FemAB family XrtA/PEP-CTERM system-associated protein [Urbifossiella limnaea]QDU20063.1 FemAB family protein [Urbifossiella limnaea]